MGSYLEHFFGVDKDPVETKAAEASSLANLLKAQCEEHEQDTLVAVQAVEKEGLTEEDLSKAAKPKTLKEKKLVSKDTFPNKLFPRRSTAVFSYESAHNESNWGP